jgi:glycosyltransferase XagB
MDRDGDGGAPPPEGSDCGTRVAFAALETPRASPPRASDDQLRLDDAVGRLRHHRPDLSASSGIWPAQRRVLALVALSLAAGAALAPGATWITVEFLFAATFGLLVALRGLAIWHLWRAPAPAATVPPHTTSAAALPIYTVLVALHDEAAVVPQLVQALHTLDYPPDRLDILIALEAHDHATRAALAAIACGPQVRVVVVPAGLPRTKPRALAYALTVARGDYVVVFDAEDKPAPDQLRAVLAVFAGDPSGTIGCVQGSLQIDNPADSWLTRQFAIEYAVLFDGLVPALAARGLPILLGGTSNHFPRRVLDETGGWDPFNVTEDADLGIRLARFGYRVAAMPSPTFEDAPDTAAIWMRQRRRWQKGWLQTYLVHMRDPAVLWRDLGPVRFIATQALLGGALASALVHPWFYLAVAWHAAHGQLTGAFGGGLSASLAWLGVFNLVAAYASSLVLARLALRTRGRGALAIHAVTTPLYCLAISWAAHVAIIDLIRAPFHWAKTPHRPR